MKQSSHIEASDKPRSGLVHRLVGIICGSLQSLRRSLKYLPHGHIWETTRMNQWYISTEEKCEWCGKYRHHLLVDVLPLGDFTTRWRDGRHPGWSAKAADYSNGGAET